MLRFDVYRNGKPADQIDLAGAYLFGQDSVPVRADLAVVESQITCVKRVAGACGLALPWDAGPAGKYLLATTRLPDRKRHYILNVELARAQVMRLIQKREDWGLFDYPDATELNGEFDRTRKVFVQALQHTDPHEASLLADEALSAALTLGEKMAQFHAGIFLGRRKSGSRASVGCVVDPLSLDEAYQHRLRDVFDYVSVPTPWKHTEPEEHRHQHAQIDAWVNWAVKIKKPICAGPLLSFDPSILPEWLYIWENDYDALRDVIYEHIKEVVERYADHVRVWTVASGIHAFNSFNLTFEQLMELTRMSCLWVKKLAPRSKVLIELVSPWGEYYARNQRTIPPLLYADMAVQSGIKFDLFGLQVCMGAPVDGLHVRDLLQISSLLDEFVSFGKPVHVTACQVPSDVAVDPLDAWGGQHDPVLAGRWRDPWSPKVQAQWFKEFSRIALSKPFVESVCWRDLADYEGHFIPHGGLCNRALEPKPAYGEIRGLRAALAGAGKSGSRNAARS